MKTQKLLALLIFALLTVSSSAWASGGGKDRGDWHIDNQSPYQVLVSISDQKGAHCLSSYVESKQKLGLPAQLSKCPFPGVNINVKVVQHGKEGQCEVTLDKMSEISFDGKECQSS